MDPVDDAFAPNYYAVIRRPMCISTMESCLGTGYYTSISLFQADFKLMMDNCKLYNGPESEYTHMAYTVERQFANLKSKYLDCEFSDEEMVIDMSFQEKKKKRKHEEEKKRKHEEEKKRKHEEEKKESQKKPRGRPKIKKEAKSEIHMTDKSLPVDKNPKNC